MDAPFFHYARHKGWRLVLLLGAAFMMLWAGAAQRAVAYQGTEGSLLAVSDLKSENCPNFQAILRYTDTHGVFINNLLNTDLKVTAGDAAGATLPVRFARVDSPPLAVAIVADLSARTRQPGLLNRPRFKDMADIISDLGPKLNNSRSTFSLVTFTDTVNTEVSQQADFRYITNALTNLESKVAPEGATEQYPLTQAIQAALGQLASAPDTANRLLFVYAAGDAASDPRAALQPVLVQMQSNPTVMTFIGLAGDLAASADALGAAHYPFFAGSLSELNTLRANIDKRYRETTLLSGYYSVAFDASVLPPGAQTVTFSVTGASTSLPLQMCSLPPQIALQSPQQIDQSRFRLSVTSQFTQTALVNVTYYLDQKEIGSASADSNFAFEFDPAAAEYHEQNFTSDREYQLTAVALDSSGQRSAVTQPLLFRLPQRAQQSQWMLLAGAGVVVMLVLAVIGVRYILRGRQEEAQAKGDDGTRPPDDTQGPGTLPPAQAPSTHRHFQPLVVTVTDHQAGRPYTYRLDNPNVAAYGIGSTEENVIRITRAAPGVSRNHAKLTPVLDGWELTDSSTYGTFLGERPIDEHKMAPHATVPVKPGMQIWIGREIVLTLVNLQPPPASDPTATRSLGDETLAPMPMIQSPHMTRNLERNPYFRPLRVVVLDTETNETYSYPLDSPTTASYDIGFGPPNFINIRRHAPDVLRNHARLASGRDSWELSALSNNVTYLGSAPNEGNRIAQQPAKVKAGDTIWIGKDFKLTLEQM